LAADILGFPHGPRPGDQYPNEVNPNEGPPAPNSPAWEILQEAANLIEGDRNSQHGAREVCHGEIAKLWTWWVGIQIDPHDVAVMMAMLKIARIKTGGYNKDCYTDATGYMAIAGELRNGKPG
jgi:hypothetical protein